MHFYILSLEMTLQITKNYMYHENKVKCIKHNMLLVKGIIKCQFLSISWKLLRIS